MDPNQTQQTTTPITQPTQTPQPVVNQTDQVQPVPPTQPTNINTSDSNKKMPLLLFVLFLLLIVIGGGIFYFLSLNKPAPKATSTAIPSPTQVISPTITPTTEEELESISIEDPTTDTTMQEITDNLQDL